MKDLTNPSKSLETFKNSLTLNCSIEYVIIKCFSFPGLDLVWGGKPKPHAIAQEDAWRRTLTFLHRWLVEDRHHAQAKL